MTEFRLRAVSPGSGRVQTLVGARALGGGEPMDIELTDAVITGIRSTGTSAPRGETIPLDGRTVMPGLHDRHVHFTLWAIASRRTDLSGAGSAQEAAHLVKRAMASHGGGVLVGVGFRDALWPDTPSATLLDSASGDTPVVLLSGDLHAVWLNSAALRLFGAPSDLSGLLTEERAFDVQKQLDEIPTELLDAWADEAAQAAAARGITNITDMEMAWNRDIWARRTQAGSTQLRVSFGVYTNDLERAISEGFQTGQIIPHTHGLVSVGPFKIITDGSLGARTACCDGPYTALDSPHSGILNVDERDLTNLMRRAAESEIACAVHAIGDRANANALNAYAESGAKGTIEHAQLMREGDIERMAGLGIAASVQPEHAMDDRDIADRHWSDRTVRSFQLRSFVDAGVRLLLGSDAPVARLDPWIAVSAAVLRTRDGRSAWHPEQSLTVREALTASVPSGRLHLREGDTADLAILDADPLTADPSWLRTMPVSGTLVNGRWTHRTL